MKKQKAVPEGTTLNTQAEHSTAPSRCATKLELVALHLLENGPTGTSSLSGLSGLHDLNFRNSVSVLRRQGVTIHDEYFPHQHQGGDMVHLKRYWLADRNQARKLAELVNLKRKARGAAPLSREQIARYLAAIPTSEQPKPAA
ncbi:MAG: hypothetical protein LRY38_09695 [Aeromonadaceae bacterium]|nr:hypothetical protein [Aeromonadaceae bacterium]